MVKLGDIIKLRPSLFEKQFKQNDQTLEWSDKYMYEDEFKNVLLNFNILGRGELAKTFFGSSCSIVTEILKDHNNKQWIIKTDTFFIFLEEALNNREITIIDCGREKFKQINSEKHLIEDLEFFEKKYLEGVYDVCEREMNKRAFYKRAFGKIIDEKFQSSG